MRKTFLKKTTAALILGTLALSLTACGGKNDATTAQNATTTAATTTAASTEATTAATTAAATESQTTEAATAAATEAPASSAVAPEEGTYSESVAGRGRMDLTKDGDSYTINVTWSGSAAEGGRWTFHGSFDANGVLTYSDCVCEHYMFDEDGNETVETDYTNGSGSLTYSNGSITWQDDQEHVADGSVFVK